MNIAPIQFDRGFLCSAIIIRFFYVAEDQGERNV